MRLPQKRIQWVCLAIAGYFLWGVFYVLSEEGLGRPKALAGAILGCVVFTLFGFAQPTKEKKAEMVSDAEKQEGIGGKRP